MINVIELKIICDIYYIVLTNNLVDYNQEMKIWKFVFNFIIIQISDFDPA